MSRIWLTKRSLKWARSSFTFNFFKGMIKISCRPKWRMRSVAYYPKKRAKIMRVRKICACTWNIYMYFYIISFIYLAESYNVVSHLSHVHPFLTWPRIPQGILFLLPTTNLGKQMQANKKNSTRGRWALFCSKNLKNRLVSNLYFLYNFFLCWTQFV